MFFITKQQKITTTSTTNNEKQQTKYIIRIEMKRNEIRLISNKQQEQQEQQQQQQKQIKQHKYRNDFIPTIKRERESERGEKA